MPGETGFLPPASGVDVVAARLRTWPHAAHLLQAPDVDAGLSLGALGNPSTWSARLQEVCLLPVRAQHGLWGPPLVLTQHVWGPWMEPNIVLSG